MSAKPLAMGMAGGGPGSFIGPIHRIAAELDGDARLCAGVFSSDPGRSQAAGKAYGIDPDRIYSDVATMVAAERQRSDGIDFLTIATPNDTHLPIALAAIEAGVHVVSDKPATATLDEALTLRDRLAGTGCLYALTYTYTGYPLIREARDIVARGDLGRLRKIHVDYPQGWLADAIENSGNKQAGWRTDPARTGVGGCISDIGVHAFNLAEYVSGERVIELLASLAKVVPGRTLDDDATVLVRFSGGAQGLITATQIAAGARNDLKIRIWGERGGLEWSHADSQRLYLRWPDRPDQILCAGSSYLGEAARRASRLPAGHPEGFIEAFATLYRDFTKAIRAKAPAIISPLSGIEEGVRSMRFIETALQSSNLGAAWLPLID
ncbi:MAG: Gfo/Idh/MocA family oxidoreductase [Pseudomonadota bacterium]